MFFLFLFKYSCTFLLSENQSKCTCTKQRILAVTTPPTRKESEKPTRPTQPAKASTHRERPQRPHQAHANLSSSRCGGGGGGDGGQPGGRAVAGSDARAAPPHEVQLQARQAPHPHRYRDPSTPLLHSSSSAGGRWIQAFAFTGAVGCRGHHDRSRSAGSRVEILVISLPLCLTADQNNAPGE
jgi:hypothetical protein